VFVR
jgi:TNF receptor-associated protein 1